MEGNHEAAKAAYLRSIETEDNPYARSKLAIMLLEEEQPAQAAFHLETGFRMAQRPGMSLSREAAAAGRYLLGVAYAKLGKPGPAREQLEQSLALNPRYENARQLLRQIEKQPFSQ
jgi:tetratricopeptide (TPR) repeat protein